MGEEFLDKVEDGLREDNSDHLEALTGEQKRAVVGRKTDKKRTPEFVSAGQIAKGIMNPPWIWPDMRILQSGAILDSLGDRLKVADEIIRGVEEGGHLNPSALAEYKKLKDLDRDNVSEDDIAAASYAKIKIDIEYHEESDELIIGFGSNAPVVCEEVDDVVLIQRSYSNKKKLSGFRILDFLKNINTGEEEE